MQLSAKIWRKAYVNWTSNRELVAIAADVMAHSLATREANYTAPNRAGLAMMMTKVRKELGDDGDENSNMDVNNGEEFEEIYEGVARQAKRARRMTKGIQELGDDDDEGSDVDEEKGEESDEIEEEENNVDLKK